MATKSKLTAIIDADTKGFFSKMQHVQVGLGTLAAGAAAIAAAGTAAAAAWKKALVSSAASVDAIGKMADRTGFGVEALQRWGFAAEQTGADMTALENSIRTMQGSALDLENGLSTQKRAFAALGLELDDIKGKSPEDMFMTIMEALGGIKDVNIRSALAGDVFGTRNGSKLIPLLKNGAVGLKDLLTLRDRLGPVFNAEQADNAAAFQDAISQVKVAMAALRDQGVTEELGRLAERMKEFAQSGELAKLIPTVKQLSAAFGDIALSISQIATNKDLIALLTKVAGGAAGLITDSADIVTGKKGIGETELGLFAARNINMPLQVANPLMGMANMIYGMLKERLPKAAR